MKQFHLDSQFLVCSPISIKSRDFPVFVQFREARKGEKAEKKEKNVETEKSKKPNRKTGSKEAKNENGLETGRN